jgi:hypothetical protein
MFSDVPLISLLDFQRRPSSRELAQRCNLIRFWSDVGTDFPQHSLLGSQNEAPVEPSDDMVITAEPLLDEEEAPLSVLIADTAAAIEQLRAVARAAAETSWALSSERAYAADRRDFRAFAARIGRQRLIVISTDSSLPSSETRLQQCVDSRRRTRSLRSAIAADPRTLKETRNDRRAFLSAGHQEKVPICDRH